MKLIDQQKSTIAIPSYQPTSALVEVVNQLRKATDRKIIVIDDGSGNEFDEIFETVEGFGAIVIRYQKNKGKGFAIKKVLEYQLQKFPNSAGLVTADGDGQHAISDIIQIASVLDNVENRSLILGVRNFNKETTPVKSYYGNQLTKKLFRLSTGISLADTQTGLRGIRQDIIPELLNIDGERFEYEMNVLTEIKEHDFKLKQIAIKTIYTDNNSNSHFHPLRDSYLVYKRFIKFGLSSLGSALIDILIFAILLKFIFKNGDTLALLTATILARFISGIFNFSINSKLVFQKQQGTTFKKYAVLFITQLSLSYVLLALIDKFISHPIPIKVLVDVLLFVGGYFIQKRLVFKKERFKNEKIKI